MNILVVAHCFPMPDRQTGMLRFWQILKILAKRHRLVFCALNLDYQTNTYGSAEVERYRDNLAGIGIVAHGGLPGEFRSLVRVGKFDVVFFEEHNTVRSESVDLSDLRFWQPRAHVIVDTVDVEFQRLMSHAEVSGKSEDRAEALEKRTVELRTYGNADLVITTSFADKSLIQEAGLQTRVDVIPLIHHIPQLHARNSRHSPVLLFVGNFELDANVDAMMYFTNEILPILKRTVPEIRLIIAGNAPPPGICALASANVNVLGYVRDLLPVYSSSTISIAPIRWGGGLKGKIVEAISFGLPVVGTKKAFEGFEFTPEENVMLADTPEAFAKALLRLLNDEHLYDKMRINAWHFVNAKFSEPVVEKQLTALFDSLPQRPVKRIPFQQRWARNIRLFLDQYVLWRFKRVRAGLS